MASEEDGQGKYANLTAVWWEWVYAQPAMNVGGTNTYPLLDSTGAYAAVGQENGIGPGNKYFFLAGTFGGPATRTVTVPAGKTLFFPVINSELDNLPFVGSDTPPTNYTVPELRAMAKAYVDATIPDSLYAKLDGVPVEFFRTKSPTFSYTLPDENRYLCSTFDAHRRPSIRGDDQAGRVRWLLGPPSRPCHPGIARC